MACFVACWTMWWKPFMKSVQTYHRSMTMLVVALPHPQDSEAQWSEFQLGRKHRWHHCLCCCAAMCCAEPLQSCPALCDLTDCSPPGSSLHGILQANILEWVTIPSSRGSSWPSGWIGISCVSCIDRRILYCCATWEAQLTRRQIKFCDKRCDGSKYMLCGRIWKRNTKWWFHGKLLR